MVPRRARCDEAGEAETTWDDIFGRENPATISAWKYVYDAEHVMDNLEDSTGKVKKFARSFSFKWGEKLAVPIEKFAGKVEQKIKDQRLALEKKCKGAGVTMEKAEEIVDLILLMREKTIPLIYILSNLANGVCTAGQAMNDLNNALDPPKGGNELPSGFKAEFCKPNVVRAAFDKFMPTAQKTLDDFGLMIKACYDLEQTMTRHIESLHPYTDWFVDIDYSNLGFPLCRYVSDETIAHGCAKRLKSLTSFPIYNTTDMSTGRQPTSRPTIEEAQFVANFNQCSGNKFPIVINAWYQWQDCAVDLTGQLRFPCSIDGDEDRSTCQNNFYKIKQCSGAKLASFSTEMTAEPGRFQASYICVSLTEWENMDLLSTTTHEANRNRVLGTCEHCHGVNWHQHSSTSSTSTKGKISCWESSSPAGSCIWGKHQLWYSWNGDINHPEWWWNEITSGTIGPGWCDIKVNSEQSGWLWSPGHEEYWKYSHKSWWDNDEIYSFEIHDWCGPGTGQYSIDDTHRSSGFPECNFGRKVYIEHVDDSKTDPCYQFTTKDGIDLGKFHDGGYTYTREYSWYQKFLTYCAMKAETNPLQEFKYASPEAHAEYEAARTDGYNQWKGKKATLETSCREQWRTCKDSPHKKCDLSDCLVNGMRWACVAPPPADTESVAYLWSTTKRDQNTPAKGYHSGNQMFCTAPRGVVLRQAHVGKGLALFDVLKAAKKLLPGDILTKAHQTSPRISFDSLVNNQVLPSAAVPSVEAVRLIWTCACPIGHAPDFTKARYSREYRGTVSTTRSGKTCLDWDTPGLNVNPTNNPKAGLERNYCRNPDLEMGGPWCYVPGASWEYCDVNWDPLQHSYRGTVSKTRSGKRCRNWMDSIDPTVEKYHHYYSDLGLGNHNYCRNHDKEPGGAWCYKEEGGWEYCDVTYPECSRCKPGTFRGRMDEESCLLCKPGTYSRDGATSCTACPKNHYSPAEGMGRCLVCPQGKIGKLPGQKSIDSCKPCKAHEIADTLAGECVPCPHNTYPDGGRCRPCRAGYYRHRNEESQCKPVPAGHEAVILPQGDSGNVQHGYRGTKNVTKSGLPCKDWRDHHFNNPKTRPFDGLSDGAYCRNPSGNEPRAWCYVNRAPPLHWEDCAVRWAEPQGTIKKCKAGTYRPAGSVRCIPVPTGFYQDEVGQTVAKQCPCERPWTNPKWTEGAYLESQCEQIPTNCKGIPDGLTLIDPDGAGCNTWLPVTVHCKNGKTYLPVSQHALIENYSEGGERPDAAEPKKGSGDVAYPWPGWRTSYVAYEMDQGALETEKKMKIATSWEWYGWMGARVDQNPSYAAFAETTRINKEIRKEMKPTANFERFMPPGQCNRCDFDTSVLARSILDLRGTPFKLIPETVTCEDHTWPVGGFPGNGYSFFHKDKALEMKNGGRCGALEVANALEIHFDPLFFARMKNPAAGNGNIASSLMADMQLFDVMQISCNVANAVSSHHCYGSENVYHDSSDACACAQHAGFVDVSKSGDQHVVMRMLPLQKDGYKGTTSNGKTSMDRSGPYGESVSFQSADLSSRASQVCAAAVAQGSSCAA
ncbi:Tissue-type plasminogen activator [Seminavis robusta]|uniref:Tissue-type plasminogen activator n=1 Tax=Seminavis robusta TaxID=568900 RepID=A0A9N8DM57_9STRA|nr:Tissue-type plasminogen activator [Seminavis robusta]|eukprot:Sro218_g090140.1 Tissue-type plasminogen activator (1560) ;mRNA; f:54183-60763